MPKTAAVIDVGSNSIKLLVAQKSEGGNALKTLFTETIETRISAGISRELPSLQPKAMDAGTKTIEELLRMARTYEPDHLAIVATSAVRDAINGPLFIQSVFDATGLKMRVLKGQEEATFIGQGLSCDPAIAGTRDFIQTDIGGGSLELIRFADGEIVQALSLQLGAVRLTERFIENKAAPLCPKSEMLIRAHVKDQLEASQFNFLPTDWPMVATGGAYTISRAVLAAQSNLSLEESSPHLHKNELNRLNQSLAPLPLHERLSTPHLPAARADILPTALITIDTLLEVAQRNQLTHSLYNLRYGIAIDLLRSSQ